MFSPRQNQGNIKDNQWRIEINRFVKEYEKELAAMAWKFLHEWKDHKNTLGIDLKPKPHFVTCHRQAIEKLNDNVNGNLQEILGILDGYNPSEEIVMIAIGEGQIKLINFQPKITPENCFTELNMTLDDLIEKLENIMVEKISPLS